MKAKKGVMTEDQFEEYLNEYYETVTICGMEYLQGTAIREVDPTAFRVLFADHAEYWECSECGQQYPDKLEANECCKE